MSNSKHTSPSSFGQLLRFWRNALKLSQAQLAERVEAAPRHLSFLETGRSNPTREMVLRLAHELDLGQRETGILLMSAGFTRLAEQLDVHSPVNGVLKNTLVMQLKKNEPYPSVLINSIGDIQMCNRGWLAMMHSLGLQEQYQRPVVNLFDLYFSQEGMKERMENWSGLACFLLLNIKEQQLLGNNEKLKELTDWLEAYPGLPEDWAIRARGTRVASCYDIGFDHPLGSLKSRGLVTGIEPERYDIASRLELHSFFPLDEATEEAWAKLQEFTLDAHPLLY
ncbi:helix-turn-helix domain-containing protein [Pseudomaricurvus alkylphenolicus]|uniref:helix-turn-helix domain-containing protein n=1 Tax=Pseudomaricurvus alkylphenolicus TaxID=1306991 RepID=UPI0014206F9A|nr:helix-turn-helix domain-containing protein [Pseudomaricurvus alkylphenolicus]NIB43039.1 helix-turn-helix domain-containing protein [Pseudomaricurvus alkylphenolicus]